MEVERLNALLRLMKIVGKNRNVQNNVAESVIRGLITMFGTIGGGFLLGPIGLFIGGIAANAVSAVVFVAQRNHFVSLREAINSMSRSEQEEIAAEMDVFIRNLDIQDIALLIARAVEAIADGGIEDLFKDATLYAIRRQAFVIVSQRLPNVPLNN